MRSRGPFLLLTAGLIVGVALVALMLRDSDDGSTVDTVALSLQEAEQDSDEVPVGIAEPYRLAELRSAGDVDIRVHRHESFDPVCGATIVRVGVSTEKAVGIMEVAFQGDPDLLEFESQYVGEPEGDYILILVARVPESVVELAAEGIDFAVSDQAAPVDGVVVLALHTGAVPAGVVSITATHVDGSTEAFDSFGGDSRSDGSGCFDEPNYPEVAPPSSTVPAGNPLEGERPEDRASIVGVYDFWYNSDLPSAERVTVLDDPQGVAEAQAIVDEQFGDTIDTAEAFVDAVTFVSETEAEVHFHIDVAGSTNFQEVGRAVLIDGSWRITRDTVCPLIQLGGASC